MGLGSHNGWPVYYQLQINSDVMHSSPVCKFASMKWSKQIWTKIMDWQDMTSGYGDWIAVRASTGVWKCCWWQSQPIIIPSLGHLIKPWPSQAMRVNWPESYQCIWIHRKACDCVVPWNSFEDQPIWQPTCRGFLQIHVNKAECNWVER